MTTAAPAWAWQGPIGCFVVAEIGVNHNGDVDLARRLVDAAAAAGADAVKFQTFDPDRIASRSAGLADYQRQNLGPAALEMDQHEMLRQLTLGDEDLGRIADHCRDAGIEFFSTAFDVPSFDLLLGLGMRLVKVPSGEITNPVLLDRYGAAGLPVLCSTGMASLGEIETALARLDAAGAAEVVVLHCTSSYPAPVDQANLRAMTTIGAAFGRPIGYSDHTPGIAVSIAAAALGARVLEKHVTLDRTLPGPDHQASLEPGELSAMVAGIRDAVAALGDGRKECVEAERSTRDVARRSVAFARDLPAGHVITAEDLDLLRPGTGLEPRHLDNVVGRELRRDVRARYLVERDDLR